jgi:hypothetical protein
MYVREGSMVKFDEGQWKVFETLNTSFGLSHLFRADLDGYSFLDFSFEGFQNSVRIAEAYLELDGVIDVGLNWTCCPFGVPSAALWPNVLENGLSYLFVLGHGSPAPGMSGAEYWYFRSTSDGIEYVGTWDRRQGGEWPQWWDEAARVLNDFDEFLEYWIDFNPRDDRGFTR